MKKLNTYYRLKAKHLQPPNLPSTFQSPYLDHSHLQLSLSYVFNCSLVKFWDCILTTCDAIVLTKSVDGLTEIKTPGKIFKTASVLVPTTACVSRMTFCNDPTYKQTHKHYQPIQFLVTKFNQSNIYFTGLL